MTEEWRRPTTGPAEFRRDAAAALVLAGCSALTAMLYTRVGWYAEIAPLWLTAVVILALTLPLALRRRYPEVVALVVAVAFFVGQQFSVPELLFSNIALFIAIYTVGAWGRNRRAANIVRGIIIAGMFVWVAANLFTTMIDPDALPEVSRSGIFSQLAALAVIQVITNLLYFGGAFYFGNAMYARARQRADLEARTRELAAEREHSAEQAVALDRMHIARELHDVVAHHVSVMGVQAGAARRVLDRDPVQAAASLETIEASARAAVDELHRLLTTLRDDDRSETSPSAFGLEQLPGLVEESSRAGLPAEFQVVGEPRTITPVIGYTLYRVAQEALTNVRKHAGQHATADVRLRYGDDHVELEVTDTGIGHRLSTAGAHHAGMGHNGMRERLAVIAGRLEVGPRARGGYLVRAYVPVTATEAP